MESSERHPDAARKGTAVTGPPSFPLPKATGKGPEEKGAKIYLSWGGEVYGPASAEEVITGLRTSWFESGSLYWHEGLEHWKPLAEFPQPDPGLARSWQRVAAKEMPAAPSLPVTQSQRKASHKGERRRRQRRSKARSGGNGSTGRKLVLGFALLAVLATVLIILLLMML